MSGVIKAATANGSVRPFIVRPRIQADFCEEDGSEQPIAMLSAANAENEALAEEIETLKRAMVAAEAAVSEADARGREKGRLEAQEDMRAAAAEQLATLERGIADMLQSWDERLSALDGLAVLIARSALSKLFDSWDESSEFVTRTIARQVRLLRRETIAAIRVSSHDFPDEQAVTELASRAATGSLRIIADPDVASGVCRADLQLGHLDLGIQAQRAQLSSLLDSLAAEEGAA